MSRRDAHSTRDGEARLGNGLPSSFRPFEKHGSPAGSALGLHPPHEGAAEFTVSIGGDPIATGSLPARRYGVADDPQDQTVVVFAQSLPAGAAEWAVDKIVELGV